MRKEESMLRYVWTVMKFKMSQSYFYTVLSYLLLALRAKWMEVRLHVTKTSENEIYDVFLLKWQLVSTFI